MIKKIKCQRCDHEWIPRVENPVMCARCKSYSWWIETPKKCHICDRTFNYLSEHHIDGNRKNNKKENRICICVDCHTSIHNGLKETKDKGNRIRKYKDQAIINRLIKYRNLWLQIKKEEKQNE